MLLLVIILRQFYNQKDCNLKQKKRVITSINQMILSQAQQHVELSRPKERFDSKISLFMYK